MKERLTEWLATLACRFCFWRYRRPVLHPPVRLADAVSILVIKLDALGDFVLVTPFLRELRRAAPRARITLVTAPAGAALAATSPHVDEALVLPPDSQPHRFGAARNVFRLARFLHTHCPGRSFDVALVPRTGRDVAHARLLAYLSGAAQRVGFQTDTAPSPRLAALTQAVAYPENPIHEVEANLLLLRAPGAAATDTALELHCRADEEASLRRRMADAGITPATPLLALGVGASLPHKLWPAENFARLARHFNEEKKWHVVVLGGAADKAAMPASSGRFFNWAGELTPAQSWCLLRSAALFVGNDSGAVHLAAAAGCPCVVVSWDRPDADPGDVNSFRRFHPHGVPFRMVHPQTADRRRDASLVSYEAVLRAADELAASSDAPASR